MCHPGGETIDIDRRQAIFYLLLAVVGLIILAASLSGLRFQPGQAIPGAEGTPLASPGVETSPTPAGTEGLVPWLLQSTLALGFILLLVIFVITLLKKTSKKRIGLIAAGLLVLFAILAWAPRAAPIREAPAGGETIQATPPPAIYNIAPIGDPPAGLYGLVIAFLLLCAALAGAWLLFLAFRRPRKEDELAREASAALQAIQEGQDLRGVIIRCYLQMTRVVQESRGIERAESVTPREFEDHLAARGIERAPIRHLTRLFEKARYGNQAPNPQDQQDAVDCLSAIRAACGPLERGAR